MGRSSILVLVTVGYGWKYVTVDLGGLVRRYWDAGQWRSTGVVGIECKGQSDGGLVMERIEVGSMRRRMPASMESSGLRKKTGRSGIGWW